jgi:isopentenyldiphosphate isomerase
MDPSVELFDLCDEGGRPLGRTKPRYAVHRDGDWHRAFHCWVVSMIGPDAPLVVLQRRSFQKATWQGLWDVSVGGHYVAGEGVEGGLREIEEELGLQVTPDQLVQAGWRKEQVFYPNGVIEREIQDVYFLSRDVELGQLQPDPAEVIEVALVPTVVLAQLARRRCSSITVPGGQVAPDRQVVSSPQVLTTESLVPRSGDYYAKVARFAQRLQQGNLPRRRSWW